VASKATGEVLNQSRASIIQTINQVMKQTIEELPKSREALWYNKVGDVCAAYAVLCSILDRPI